MKHKKMMDKKRSAVDKRINLLIQKVKKLWRAQAGKVTLAQIQQST